MKTYHHGDLKSSLLSLAREQLTSTGRQSNYSSLSLRELARLAGVSPTAVYYHFSSKEALLEELACQTFDALIDSWKDLDLEDLGTAYIEFFRTQPAMLDLLFGPYLGKSSRVRHLQNQSFEILTHNLPQSNENPSSAALMMWALVHGLAHLYKIGALGAVAEDCGDVPELWLQKPEAIMKSMKPHLDRVFSDS